MSTCIEDNRGNSVGIPKHYSGKLNLKKGTAGRGGTPEEQTCLCNFCAVD